MLLLASFVVGSAVLAAWLYVRLPGQAVPGGRVLLGHLLVSYAFLALVPAILDGVAFDGATGPREAVALLLIFLPALVYAALVALWLLAYLRAAHSGARG